MNKLLPLALMQTDLFLKNFVYNSLTNDRRLNSFESYSKL